MNKKISTLMAGLLLTGTFASAENLQTNLLEKATLKSGEGYFVVRDKNGNGAWDANEPLLKVSLNGSTLNYGAGTSGDVAQYKWTYTETKYETPEGTTYYYSLKNEAAGAFLSFKSDGTLITNLNDSKDGKADEALFIANRPMGAYSNGGILLSYKGVKAGVGATLYFETPSTVGLGNGVSSNILFCEYKENTLPASEATAKTLNDVKGGAGFNFEFNADNSYDWTNNILDGLNLKAFYVNIPTNQFSTTDQAVPQGIYFATADNCPASLSGKNTITTLADFQACTFVAINPDVNYLINEVNYKDGIGFELMTVAGADMNLYKSSGSDEDQLSHKGDVYVGNACFSIIVPDPMRAAKEYQLEVKDARLLTDASKTLHGNADVYVGVITDLELNYLVSTEKADALTFTATNTTLYDVTKLLKSEDAPSIYTIQFASEVNKNVATAQVSEKDQYLTISQQGTAFALTSVEEINPEDPMFQFVITNVDKTNKKVTFANRQTKATVEVSLYENEDGTFTVYPTNTNTNLYIETFDNPTTGGENGVIEFKKGNLANTKVILSEVTVEDKFATFSNRAEGAGLVTFELAKNADADAELYVGATRNTTTGEINPNGGDLRAYADDMIQFELVKSDDYEAVTNNYVYMKDSRVLTSRVKDTVAYYTYQVKAFDAEITDLYMQITAATPAAKLAKTNAANVIIKKNIDGSVSLINATSATILSTPSAQYMEVNANKDKDGAWKIGANYDLASKLSEGLKTFMVDEDPAISYEAVPQHVSFQAALGGFLTMDENKDARLAIKEEASEELTFWIDTVHSDRNIPSFYITKGGNFLYNATDSATVYSAKGNDRFTVEISSTPAAKLIFKAGELVSSDTLQTVVDGQKVLVAEKDNAPKKIKGGLNDFQFQIISAQNGSDEYVIRQGAQYVCQVNNFFYLGKKDAAYSFIIEKQSAPTANDEISTSEIKVIAGNGQITIAGAAGKKVVVSNILGQVVANTVITSDNATIAAPQGIVVVAVEGEEAVKAIVK